MRRRGFGATHSGLPGDGGAPLAGITTCRQELADRRGWSTFSKARPAHRKNAAVECRKARSSASQRRNGAIARRPIGRVSQTAHRGPRKPQRLPALRSPRWGPGIAIRDEGVPGADTRTRAMNHVHRHSGARAKHASPESIHHSIKKEINAVPNTSTAAYGFRVRPCGPPRNDAVLIAPTRPACEFPANAAPLRSRPETPPRLYRQPY